MRRLIPLAAASAAVVALAGCSADAKDFKEQGEKFLEGDEVREQFGMVRMSDAECAEPANTDKDTLYSCTATGSDGNTWGFTIEITGSTSLRVIEGVVVGQGSVPPGSAPASSAEASDPSTAAAPTTAAGTTTAAPTTATGATAAAPTTAAATTTTTPG